MNLIELTSFEDPALDVFARLTEPQLRNRLEPEKGIFIAESPKVIARALDGGMQALSVLVASENLELYAEIIRRCGDVPIYAGEAQMLKQLTGFPLTRGVLCAMRRPKLPSVEVLLENAHRIAVLEEIADHTNVGAVFRSAAALDVDAVLVTPSCADPLYRRSVRVSMGTVFQIPWTRIGENVSDWPDAGMRRIRELGFKTAAFALSDDSVSPDDEELNAQDKLAMIFGTEGDGLSERTIAACDYTVKIPMSHGVDSLNVAAASAVAFWQLCR